MRTATSKNKFSTANPRPQKSCPLCSQARRPSRHFLSECSYLPEKDRKYLAKAREIVNIVDQHLSGFFSAKLRGRQVTWLPCEVEALSIAVAIEHLHPYIVQSIHKACILTDSKPCVQAFEKLCRGEFSASPRVSTFLSTVSR